MVYLMHEGTHDDLEGALPWNSPCSIKSSLCKTWENKNQWKECVENEGNTSIHEGEELQRVSSCPSCWRWTWEGKNELLLEFALFKDVICICGCCGMKVGRAKSCWNEEKWRRTPHSLGGEEKMGGEDGALFSLSSRWRMVPSLLKKTSYTTPPQP